MDLTPAVINAIAKALASSTVLCSNWKVFVTELNSAEFQRRIPDLEILLSRTNSFHMFWDGFITLWITTTVNASLDTFFAALINGGYEGFADSIKRDLLNLPVSDPLTSHRSQQIRHGSAQQFGPFSTPQLHTTGQTPKPERFSSDVGNFDIFDPSNYVIKPASDPLPSHRSEQVRHGSVPQLFGPISTPQVHTGPASQEWFPSDVGNLNVFDPLGTYAAGANLLAWGSHAVSTSTSTPFMSGMFPQPPQLYQPRRDVDHHRPMQLGSVTLELWAGYRGIHTDKVVKDIAEILSSNQDICNRWKELLSKLELQELIPEFQNLELNSDFWYKLIKKWSTMPEKYPSARLLKCALEHMGHRQLGNNRVFKEFEKY